MLVEMLATASLISKRVFFSSPSLKKCVIQLSLKHFFNDSMFMLLLCSSKFSTFLMHWLLSCMYREKTTVTEPERIEFQMVITTLTSKGNTYHLSENTTLKSR